MLAEMSCKMTPSQYWKRNMFQLPKHLVIHNENCSRILSKVFPLLVRNTKRSIATMYTMKENRTLFSCTLRYHKSFLRQYSTNRSLSSSKNSQSKSYKELDVEKLLDRINKGDKTVLNVKTKEAVEPKVVQLHEGIKKAAAQIVQDQKSMFKFFVKISCFLTVTMVPISIFCCWYSPAHRVKTSKQSPQWGKVIDLIFDPMDDDTKLKAGLPVEQAKNIDSPVFVKENSTSFKNSLVDNLKEKRNNTSTSPETLN